MNISEFSTSIPLEIIRKPKISGGEEVNSLQPIVAFLYPLKISPPENIRKPLCFLMFSGGIEKQHRVVMV